MMNNPYNNFVPSQTLFDLYIKGLITAFELVKKDDSTDKRVKKELGMWELKTHSLLKEQLFEEIAEAVAMEGSHASAYDLTEFQLSEDNKFTKEFQDYLIKNFIICPEDMGFFMETFHKELVTHLSNPCNIFSAAWGKWY